MPPTGPNPSKWAKHVCNGGPKRCLRLSHCRTALAQPPAEPALDERIDIAVQNGLRVAHLEAGPNVLHKRVGLKHVVADLRSELGRHDLAADLVELRRSLLLLALKEARLQHLHGHLAVLHL